METISKCKLIKLTKGEKIFRGTRYPEENFDNDVLWMAFDKKSAGIYAEKSDIYSYVILEDFYIFDMADLYTRNFIIKLSNFNDHCQEVYPTYIHPIGNKEHVGRESEFVPDTKCLERIRKMFPDYNGKIIGIGNSTELFLSHEGKKAHHPEMALFNNDYINLRNYLKVVNPPKRKVFTSFGSPQGKYSSPRESSGRFERTPSPTGKKRLDF